MDQTISKSFVFLENVPELMHLLEDIFINGFTQEYTHFGSFEGLRYSGAVVINQKVNTLIYVPPLLDAFVKESTDFVTRDEMVRSAIGLCYRRQRLSAAFQHSLRDPSRSLPDDPSEY